MQERGREREREKQGGEKQVGMKSASRDAVLEEKCMNVQ